MTKLEYEICEACQNGEIDTDTKDTLLDIIMIESANNKEKEIEYLKKLHDNVLLELKTVEKRLNDVTHDRNVLNNQKDGLYYKRHRTEVDNEIESFNRKIKELKSQKEKLNLKDAEYCKKLNELNKDKIDKYVRELRAKGQDRGRRPIKESVNELKMEIYERELSGDITADERELLISYMEAKTDEE